MGWKHDRSFKFYLLLTLIFIFLSVVSFRLGILPAIANKLTGISLTTEDFANFIKSLGAMGVAGSIGLMILHSFVPFPAELLTMANGMVYGPLWGVIITWVGAMFGAYAAFGLTRWLGRPFIEKWAPSNYKMKIDAWSQEEGATALLIARLIPVISFNVVNYAAGLTKVSLWTFFWTTGIGILPMTILMVMLGDSVIIIPVWVWFMLAVLIIALWYFRKRRV
ncbi:MAG: TVP38/TMEM64 family protein [Desulfobacterales bacterium]|nr:TVP38/TMEM64 family protein [Desulfobacterales bacterium]